MPPALSAPDQARLKQWIETSLASNSNALAAGYQGQTLIYRDQEKALVIKVPLGRGLMRWLNTRMLRHEYAVYRQLGDFYATPGCYGLIDNKYLVLEHIAGLPIRQHRPDDEDHYFSQLFQAIGDMHERGVAHMDLKKKDNLLVVSGNKPCLIDFGAAVIYQPGLHPFNHFRYRLGIRFDYNAWIKHKYHDRMAEISVDDKPYYKKTLTEIVSRKIKYLYKDWFLLRLRRFLK